MRLTDLVTKETALVQKLAFDVATPTRAVYPGDIIRLFRWKLPLASWKCVIDSKKKCLRITADLNPTV